jgi:hypothetical protein
VAIEIVVDGLYRSLCVCDAAHRLITCLCLVLPQNPALLNSANRSVSVDFMSSNNKKAQQEEHHIRTLGLECLTSIVRSLEIAAGLYQPQEMSKKAEAGEGSTGNVSALDGEEDASVHTGSQHSQQVQYSSHHGVGLGSGSGGGVNVSPTPSASMKGGGFTAAPGSTFSPSPVVGLSASNSTVGIAMPGDGNRIVDVFDKKQRFNEELETGILKFNLNPKSGLSYLAKMGHIEMTPKSVADFFHQVRLRV